ncbi:sensor histidine kinase [Novosphingobium jiangmenense]|uniref:histidine kinase n=1 Tax=Novosphingobium jiangmenense TaxID=2791981 RepID=A0ABS0HCX5_9SPHN|nr:HAMP domain-containing sensor histidine kinase [Novosphingobium jiangmenense]MBF9150086.1 HAMP domain-containing histidine kinase [Novosphingobium jiangmenense]
MTTAGQISARCDAADRLIEADEALAALQVRMGGSYPGTLAIPELLALVRRSRMGGLALSSRLTVGDEGQPLSFSARVAPDESGTRLEIADWKVAEQAWQADAAVGADDGLLRTLAEAHVVLDAEQRVVSGVVDGADLAEFAAALNQGFGRYWTSLVEVEGNLHRQPLHWRLLDGVRVRVPGSGRLWQAKLLPLRAGGFELLLVAETVLATNPAPEGHRPAATGEIGGWKGLLGQKLAPALRMPINRIIANAETIRTRLAGPLDDHYAGYAADIAEAGRHLAALVEDLADLETVEDSDFTLAVEPVDLGDCARRAAGILGVRAQEKGIALVLPGSDEFHGAMGEFRRVLQILLNLIGNAIRYAPGQTTVRIQCGGEGDSAWIAVEDEGDGIAPGQAEKVFEKFERLGRSGDGGSGLGLYISRKLARAMGGDLSVGKSPAGGARFVLQLPAAGTGQISAAG